MKKLLLKLISTVESKAWYFIIGAILFTGLAIPGILQLETSTGMDTLVSSDAQVFQNTKRHDSVFGSEPISVHLEGNLRDLFSTDNLIVLSSLEEKILEHDQFNSILSPVTVLNLAIDEASLQEQVFKVKISSAVKSASEEAIKGAKLQNLGANETVSLVNQAVATVMQTFQPYIDAFEEMGEPSLTNSLFIDKVLYAENGQLSPAMSDFIPKDGNVLISITPIGNLPHEDALSLVSLIEKFFVDNPLSGVSATIVADTLIIETIATEIGGNLTILLALAVIVMALILLFVFPVRWRLLSLFIVGISATWTFGLMGYLGVPLSMATMAVLPVLIGLGIDYSVQFHNHFQEEISKKDSIAGVLVASATRMFPAAGIALIATIIGFITLYISDVPMVRDFGIILSVGVFLSYVSALFLLHSVLYLLDKNAPIDKLKKSADNQRLLERALSRMARRVLKMPLLILVLALSFAVAGINADQYLESSTDFKELMSPDSPVLQGVERLSALYESGPPLRFMVEAKNVTSPEFLQWLYTHQEEMVDKFPPLLSAKSLSTLVMEGSSEKIPDSQDGIDNVLASVPTIFLNQFVSTDKKMTSLTFSAKDIPMEEHNTLLKELNLLSANPLSGVKMVSVGAITLGASTIDSIMGKRFLLNIICLSAILLVLLLIYRRFTNAILTILTVGLVIAWSSLVLHLADIPLNPLTAILGVIVIGIGTEFMVLIISRYEEEKNKGNTPTEAMVIAISKIGRAVVITALTTLGGFGVLITSDFILIRDFGIATVSGVFLCLIGSTIVMPPLLVFFDEKIRAKKRNE
ncbi:MAG: efflux RND transporter permease subunit [Alkaliphilus sp.]